MANHAECFTKCKLTPEYVTELLNRLNQTLFKGALKIEYFPDGGWSSKKKESPTWMISTADKYVERICWLNSSRHFEMRHGGGMNVAWYVDGAILAYIAHEKKGRLSDDGCGPYKDTIEKYQSFRTYIEAKYANFKDFSDDKKFLRHIMENDEASEPFKDPEWSKYTVKITKIRGKPLAWNYQVIKRKVK